MKRPREYHRAYSAYVSLALYAQGEAFDLAKTGPDRVVLQDENKHPRGAATLFITVGRTTKLSPITIDETRCNGREVGYLAGSKINATWIGNGLH